MSEVRKTRVSVNASVDLKIYTDVEKIRAELDSSKKIFKKFNNKKVEIRGWAYNTRRSGKIGWENGTGVTPSADFKDDVVYKKSFTSFATVASVSDILFVISISRLLALHKS